jgi:ribosomal protein S3
VAFRSGRRGTNIVVSGRIGQQISRIEHQMRILLFLAERRPRSFRRATALQRFKVLRVCF